MDNKTNEKLHAQHNWGGGKRMCALGRTESSSNNMTHRERVVGCDCCGQIRLLSNCLFAYHINVVRLRLDVHSVIGRHAAASALLSTGWWWCGRLGGPGRWLLVVWGIWGGWAAGARIGQLFDVRTPFCRVGDRGRLVGIVRFGVEQLDRYAAVDFVLWRFKEEG